MTAIVLAKLMDPLLLVPLAAFLFWARKTVEPLTVFLLGCGLGFLVTLTEELFLLGLHHTRTAADALPGLLASGLITLTAAAVAAAMAARYRRLREDAE